MWIGNNSSPEEVGRDGKCGQDNSALKDGSRVVATHSVVVVCLMEHNRDVGRVEISRGQCASG